MGQVRSLALSAAKVAWTVSGIVIVGGLFLVFVLSLQPHAAAEGHSQPASGANPAQARASASKSLPLVTYYYVVESEEAAARTRADMTSGADYYGAGYPDRQPIVVVARTPEAFATLQSLLDQTEKAGGPPSRIMDLRPRP